MPKELSRKTIDALSRDDWSRRLLHWQAKHGRHDLPWQNTRDPYRVWLSEIMLQQTQVTTVLGYYERFLGHFPDVRQLAATGVDDVLALWSGLGYYSRARNLHACAVQIARQHGGEFPRSAHELEKLPGIGRSTAAAIASICFGERVAILDGNVRRVLTRALGFAGDLAQSANERKLWELADTLLPQKNLVETMPRYTQAVMDLGATVCLPKNPNCEACPVAELCVAKRESRPEAYPVKTRKLKRTAQSLWLLCAETESGAVWLRQRPASREKQDSLKGVWTGLYAPELFDSFDALQSAVPAAYRNRLQELPPAKHVLTHKDLHLHPVRVQLHAPAKLSAQGAWHGADSWPRLGLPAPVRKLLQNRMP